MKKKILISGIVLALVAVMAMPMAALAVTGEAEQGASTTLVTTISIKNVAGDADVATITFPAASGGSTVTNPTGNVDLQALTEVGADASPVAILTSATAYTLWYNVTSITNWPATVATEYIETIAIDGSLTLADFISNADQITVWDTDQATTQSLAAGVNKELYLGVLLQSAAGQSGTSTLTVLGEG